MQTLSEEVQFFECKDEFDTDQEVQAMFGSPAWKRYHDKLKEKGVRCARAWRWHWRWWCQG